jgi:hypothetical protein
MNEFLKVAVKGKVLRVEGWKNCRQIVFILKEQ